VSLGYCRECDTPSEQRRDKQDTKAQSRARSRRASTGEVCEGRCADHALAASLRVCKGSRKSTSWISQSAEGAPGAFALVPETAGCVRALLCGGLPLPGTTAGAVLASGTSTSSSGEKSITSSGAVILPGPGLPISDLLVLAILAQGRASSHHAASCCVLEMQMCNACEVPAWGKVAQGKVAQEVADDGSSAPVRMELTTM